MAAIRAEELVQQVLHGRVSRRVFLQRAIQLGLSMPLITAVLAACGGATSPATSAPATGGSAAPAASGGASASPASAGKPGGSLTFGINLEMDSIDPAVTPYAVSHTLMMNVFDPLLWRDKEGKFHPGLAERWETNADGTEYTFALRQGVKFHDGTPWNAAAVKFNLDRIADPATKSGFAVSLIGPYDRTEVIDDRTAKVVLKAPFAPLLDGLSQAFLGMSSPTAVQAKGKDYLRSPVGTGFMKFVEWIEKDHITLERNPDYAWAPPFFAHTGPAYLAKLTFRFYSDDPTRLAALESSDAQLITPIPTSNVKRVEGESKFTVMHAFNPGMPTVLLMNTSKAPTNDLAVRQALNFGLDRQNLIDVGTFGTATPAHGPLGANTPFYSKAVEAVYPFSVDKAKQTLQNAGWVAGGDGIRTKGGQRLTLTYGVTPAAAAYAELIQAQLRTLGVEIQLVQGTAAAITEAMVRGEHNMAGNGWVSSDPVVLTTMFHSKNTKSGYGWHKYSDPKLDEALDAGERTLDEAKRAQVYAEAQKIIMDQAIILPLFVATNSVGVESKYKDVKRDFRNYVWLYDTYVG